MNIYPQVFRKSIAFASLFALVFVQIAPFIAHATTSEVGPQSYVTYDTAIIKDSYVDQDTTGGKNNVNYGTANSIEVKSLNGKNRRIFIQANTPTVPSGAVIDSVRLNVFMYNRPSTSIRLYSISQVMNSWDENTITWNNQPTVAPVPIAIHSILPVNNTWVTFEVTADVQAVLDGQSSNNGWVIQDKFENSGSSYLAEFRSREYSGVCADSPSPLCKPYLEVTYHYEGGITGNVWNDVNVNGIKDEGELPKEGEVIWIYNETTNLTATSTSDGTYAVNGLVPGEYKVCRSTLNTTTQSFPTSGVLCPGNTQGKYVEVINTVTSGPDFGVFDAGSVKILLNTNPIITEDSFSFHLAHNNATTTHTLYAGQTEYIFTGVVPGESYSISQVVPLWWAQDSVSCVSGETPVSPDSFAVQAGNEVVCTFSNVKKSSLSVTNYVEPVLGTYSFTLSSVDNQNILGPVVLGNNESHVFISLTPGMYNLVEVVENNLDEETALCTVGDTVVDPRSGPFEIPAGVNIQCVYNHSQLGVVQGTVFEDMNGDTVRDDVDLSLSGWIVKLYKITEEMITSEGSEVPVPTLVTTEVSSRTTNEIGYMFGQLNPGTYKVCQEKQIPFIQSLPLTNEGCETSRGYTMIVNLGEIINKDFGNFNLGTLSGVVFSDVNNNGIKDEGEVGIPGVTVYLGNTAVTNSNGEYNFTELMPGKYVVSLSGGLPASASYSSPISGKHEVIITSGYDYKSVDFGIFTDTDTPSLPVHQTPASGAVVRALGLILDWSDSIDPSLSGVSYHYQSSVSSATTTGNALSTPIYGTTISASQIDASGTSEGMYFWQVKACDTAYNCTSWTNPWSVTVDTTAPVSTFTSPNPDSNIEDEHIVIAGSTTDAHMVASTTLAYAPYIQATEETAASCGAYTSITSLVNETASTTFNWSYNWTPETDGVYCLTAHGQDEAGNTEASPFVTNITFKKKAVTTTSGGDSSSGGGTGGSGTGGGSTASNGPIVGSFGGSQSGGAPVMLAVGGSPDGAVIPTQNSSTEPSSYQSTGGTSGAFSGNLYTGGSTNDSGLTDAPRASTTRIQENNDTESESDNNVAAVSFAGEWNNWYWLWLLLLICIILGVYYSTRRRNE